MTDLPFAEYLESLTTEIAPYGNYDTVRVDDREVEDVEAGNAKFTESALSTVTFTGGHMRGARFNDVWLGTVRWVGTDLADTQWLDVEFARTAMAGIDCYRAEFRRVSFFNCKLDSVNWRAATFHVTTQLLLGV